MSGALPIHAWVYGMHAPPTTEEIELRFPRMPKAFGARAFMVSWRCACGAIVSREDGNLRVFGPTRLRVVWPIKRHKVTCEACLAIVDARALPAVSEYMARVGPMIGRFVAAQESRRAAALAAEAERAIEEAAERDRASIVIGAYPLCGAPVKQPPGAGRPRKYCSASCSERARADWRARWRRFKS